MPSHGREEKYTVDTSLAKNLAGKVGLGRYPWGASTVIVMALGDPLSVRLNRLWSARTNHVFLTHNGQNHP